MNPPLLNSGKEGHETLKIVRKQKVTQRTKKTVPKIITPNMSKLIKLYLCEQLKTKTHKLKVS